MFEFILIFNFNFLLKQWGCNNCIPTQAQLYYLMGMSLEREGQQADIEIVNLTSNISECLSLSCQWSARDIQDRAASQFKFIYTCLDDKHVPSLISGAAMRAKQGQNAQSKALLERVLQVPCFQYFPYLIQLSCCELMSLFLVVSWIQEMAWPSMGSRWVSMKRVHMLIFRERSSYAHMNWDPRVC